MEGDVVDGDLGRAYLTHTTAIQRICLDNVMVAYPSSLHIRYYSPITAAPSYPTARNGTLPTENGIVASACECTTLCTPA